MATKKYLVMALFKWDCLTTPLGKLQAPEGGPQRFMAVFDTREEAENFASKNGNKQVQEVECEDQSL